MITHARNTTWSLKSARTIDSSVDESFESTVSISNCNGSPLDDRVEGRRLQLGLMNLDPPSGIPEELFEKLADLKLSSKVHQRNEY